jgi:chemotaxis protein histidine kinase CheA
MSSLTALLAELQKNYLASFNEKAVNLEHLWKTGKLEELTTEYHKLKGTGRTYGLPEVTQLGEVLESICEYHVGLHDEMALTAALANAVPVSLRLLDRIQTSRTSAGEEYLLDTDPDFLLLLSLLPKKTGRPARSGS